MASSDIDDLLPVRDQPSVVGANVTQHDIAARRLLVTKTFKHLLVAMPFPAVAWLFWLGNFHGSYFQHNDRPRLCDLSPQHCDTLVSIPVFVMPAAGLFILASLLTLDHYLLVSPVFQPSLAPEAPSTNAQNDVASLESICPLAQATGATEKQGRCACAVLRFCAFIACILCALCALASILAIVSATLVLKSDSPFDKAKWDNRVIFRTSILGCGEALFDALLAYYLGMIALTLLEAKYQVDPSRADVGREGSTLPQSVRLQRAWNRDVEAHWHPRAPVDKVVGFLAMALALSFVSAIICLQYEPFGEHLVFLPFVDPFLCFAAALFAWSALLTLHTYSSSALLPTKAVRVWVFSFSLILGSLRVLISSVYALEIVRASLCPRFPHPFLCSFVKYHGLLPAVLSTMAGYLQAWCLGRAGVVAWMMSGIQLDGVD